MIPYEDKDDNYDDDFTHRRWYTHKLLHASSSVTHRRFYTWLWLHDFDDDDYDDDDDHGDDADDHVDHDGVDEHEDGDDDDDEEEEDADDHVDHDSVDEHDDGDDDDDEYHEWRCIPCTGESGHPVHQRAKIPCTGEAVTPRVPLNYCLHFTSLFKLPPPAFHWTIVSILLLYLNLLPPACH